MLIVIADSQKLNETIENNNFVYATSTPMNNRVQTNGNGSDISLNATNGHYDVTEKTKDISPIRNYQKEQLMNSINANTKPNINTKTIIAEIEGEAKKRPKLIDKTYYVAKEILMTEITYRKDLDVILKWVNNEVGQQQPEECKPLLVNHMEPLAKAHEQMVKDLEHRIQGWDARGGKTTSGKISDILLTHLPPILPIYEAFIETHAIILEYLEHALKTNPQFASLYREFESQKMCYVPFTTFILKPLHRLYQYHILLQQLFKFYGPNHPDRTDCLTANDTIKELIPKVVERLQISENMGILCELQKDIIGFDNLYKIGRTFVRHGCLLKESKKGYQQRMFFLFSDILLYTSRSQTTQQFKVHGILPLRGILTEDAEGEIAAYGLKIYGGNRSLTVAASTPQEKQFWKEDLNAAIQEAKDHNDGNLTYLSLKSCSSSEEMVDQCGNDVSTQTIKSVGSGLRNNTIVNVCWHRNTSISLEDHLIAVENQLSGFLLRKFKTSNGWQKLWVVFTSFCLFFYKGCTDENALASLPLLGYTIGQPSAEDNIAKDFVFKLQYKNHIYFFRAESEYTYNRWIEAISSATQTKLLKKLHQLDENSIESSPEK